MKNAILGVVLFFIIAFLLVILAGAIVYIWAFVQIAVALVEFMSMGAVYG